MGLGRIDGLAKVLARKLYASDFRAADMVERAGWPNQTMHALLVRAGSASRVFQGLQDAFPGHCRPVRLITAEDLTKNGIPLFRNSRPPEQEQLPEREREHWLLPTGTVARHAGQPVAIAYFADTMTLADAATWLRDGGSPVVLGRAVGPVVEADVRRIVDPLLALVQRKEAARYGRPTSLVRIAGEGSDEFSLFLNQSHDPYHVGGDPSDEAIKRNRAAREAWQRIEDEMATRGWEILERTFYTPTHDPMFMEPEAGLAYWDRAASVLHLVVGTQSPSKDRDNVAAMLGQKSAFGPSTIQMLPCYPGGGFGGRDDAGFPCYLALAALFGGAPVRLAYDRFEQFRTGLKRHAAVVQNRLAYDRVTGAPQALIAHIVMDGGGEANLTPPVIGLAVLHAAGPYRIPRTVLTGLGVVTPGAPAGSMRGFGIPQATIGIDCMIDEVAVSLGRDPIAYRLEHVLRQHERDVTGMVLEHHLANREVAEIALRQPLWREREQSKAARSRANELAFGVGFAMCMQAFGTTTDAAFAAVSLDGEGRITVHSSAVDMGQGAATAVSLGTSEALGSPAYEVEMAQDGHFDPLALITARNGVKFDPTNERHSLKYVNAMSASMTAFHKVHAVREACEVLWDHGIVPAAAALAGVEESEVTRDWRDGRLSVAGREFTLVELANAISERRLVSAAMVHTFFQNEFASAEYGVRADRLAARRNIDALAVRMGTGEYQRVSRTSPSFPPKEVQRSRRTLYASVGHLVAVEVRLKSGLVRVLEAITILDAGKVHHAPLLEGQVEGGLAMGIGMALLEEIPPSPEGTDPRWNLHRYAVPRARHVPVDAMRLELVPFADGGSILSRGPVMQKKGIAEAVMTTVAPAVLNAFAHATGLRMNRVPLTPQRVLEALGKP